MTGIDVELASSVSPAAAARRENLDLFVQAVAEFQAVDGQVTLAALLAWLEAEDEFGQASTSPPSEADSSSAHRPPPRAEWDAVFLVGVAEQKFPTNRTRSSWLTVPFVLPTALRGDARDLLTLAGHTATTGRRSPRQAGRSTRRLEEPRLGYVAWTRARHTLSGLGVLLGAPAQGRPRPSSYLVSAPGGDGGLGRCPGRLADTARQGRARNPYARGRDRTCPGRSPTTPRGRAPHRGGGPGPRGATRGRRRPVEDMLLLDRVAQWDAEIGPAAGGGDPRPRATVVEVPLPSSPSATSLARLRDDPEAFARDLARPMPRQAVVGGPLRHPLPRLGREPRSASSLLIDPDDLPGRADPGIDDDAELAGARRALREPVRSPTGSRTRWSRRSRWCWPARWCAAASTRSTPTGRATCWSTGRPTARPNADPLQLAIYRLARAELHGVPLERVRAAFYYVRTGEPVEPTGWPDRRRWRRCSRSDDSRARRRRWPRTFAALELLAQHGARRRPRSRPAAPCGSATAVVPARSSWMPPCLGAQVQGSEVADRRPEAGGPEDHAGRPTA